MSNLPEAALERYTPKISGRVPSLDGLRGISILFVLLGHAALSDHAPHVLAPFSHAGNVGVRFFFIISGFLITTLLMKEWRKTNTISLRGFYLRRVLRIFPAVYTLIAVVAVCAAFGLIRLKPGEVFYAATFTMNFKAFWLGQLWSLSVEEQFYLLWPGLLLLAGTRRAFRSVWVVVLLSPLLRFCMWHFWHASETAMTKHFESVADSLGIGCLLAAYFNQLGLSQRYQRFQSHTVLFLSIGVGAIAIGNGLFLVNPGAFYVWGQSIANIGTVMCIDWAIRHPEHGVGQLLNWKPLVVVGVLSYSLYLWQNPFLLGDAGKIWTTYPYNLGFAVAMALLSYFLIERPFLQLKDVMNRRKAGVTRGAPSSV
jgi:peptidoglycan/LPS O-acetylase OafA/YrhL